MSTPRNMSELGHGQSKTSAVVVANWLVFALRPVCFTTSESCCLLDFCRVGRWQAFLALTASAALLMLSGVKYKGPVSG